MSDRVRHILSVLTILAVALIVWLPTLGWGLPSRDSDKYLFGDRTPWTGAEIIALTAITQPAATRGADVDADPILDRSKPVLLNDTDAKRAAIVRRYRLMSGQPDEFIQFKALSEMAARPGLAKLDPRLYQYGGLWMYPVGAMVRASMLVGIIQTPPPGTPAMEFYLDHPEAFGRFYVVARFYSWCWGVVAAFAIVWIARRITNSIPLATLAAVAFMLTPVVRTATHEAKPHLAGAALCLCAVITATKYVETGRRRWMLAASALCGASMAMVVSMLLSCVVLPVMCWLRWRAIKPTRAGSDGSSIDARSDPTPQGSAWVTLFASLACAAIVYCATNPYVLINAIAHPEILRSNLGNSTAMYSPRSDGLQAVQSAVRIACAGLTGAGLFCGTILAAASIFYRCRHQPERAVIEGLLLALAFVIVAQFILLAEGKPLEYARFGLVPGAVLLVFAARGISQSPNRSGEVIVVLSLVWLLFSAVLSPIVWNEEARDRQNLLARGSDRILNEQIAQGELRSISVVYELAPWSAPPMSLFDVAIKLTTANVAPSDPEVSDLFVFPLNLATQLGFDGGHERVDWRANEFGAVAP